MSKFTRKRRARGKRRPAPLVVRVANCASVSTGPAKSTETFRRALVTCGLYGLPHVVLCQEMSDVDAKEVAAEVGGWKVEQHGPIGSPDSGLAICWRTDRGQRLASELKDGTPATHEGGGIRKRPILIDRLLIDGNSDESWTSRFGSGHAAPGRAPHDRARFLSLFNGIGARVRGGDLNIAARLAAHLFARRVFSIGVLHLIVSRWIPAEGPKPVDHGSDHKGVDVLLWPTKG